MHGKPKHRWERHKLDKKSVLESKGLHENRRRVVTRNSHQKRRTTSLCVITLSVGGTTINNLRSADDTVLQAETEEDLQEILNEVNRIGKPNQSAADT